MMLANYPFDDSVPHFGFGAASARRFRAASIELCTRLWLELERMCAALQTDDLYPPAWLELRVEILRLELLIMRDRCAHRWRIHLDHRQRAWLETLIDDLLAALEATADGLPDRYYLAQAQNSLLSAILDRCRDQSEERIEIPLHAASHHVGHSASVVIFAK